MRLTSTFDKARGIAEWKYLLRLVLQNNSAYVIFKNNIITLRVFLYVLNKCGEETTLIYLADLLY